MNPIKPPEKEKLPTSKMAVFNPQEYDAQRRAYLSQAEPEHGQEPDYAMMILNQLNKKENIITETEFAKYIPLFSKEVAAQVKQAVDTPDEPVDVESLRELAVEYHRKFNQYKPVYVVDNTGNVVTVLPPQYRRLDAIDQNKMHELMAKIRIGSMYDDGNVNSIANIQSEQAMRIMSREFYKNIDSSRLKDDTDTYRAYQREFIIRKYAEEYRMPVEQLRALVERYEKGEDVTFPWQEGYNQKENESNASETKRTGAVTSDVDLPMDIFG